MLELRTDKNPVRRHGHRRGLIQPNMTVNPRAFVKPALAFRRVHAHGNRVLAAEMQQVRNVLAERIVTAFVMSHTPAVDPDGRVAKYAVESQPDTPSLVFPSQVKGAAIPTDAVGWILCAQRLESVTAVSIRVKRQFDRPVVRQIDGAPVRVGELLRSRTGTGAGIFQVQRIGPVVTKVELPVRVEREMFPRRIGGGKRRGWQRRTYTGNEQAKEGCDFHF